MPYAGSTHYVEYGSGEPLVLIHGNTLDHRMWDDCRPFLVSLFRVIAVDLPGHGKSGLAADGPPAADEVAGVLRALGIDQAMVCGLSLGGGIAVNFALQHPLLCRALVAVDAAVFGYKFAHWPGVKPYVLKARLEGLAPALEAWLADSLFGAACATPAVAERLRSIVREFPGQTWLSASPPLVAPGRTDLERLGEISVPTLVVVGEHDLPDFQIMADLLAGQIAGARKVVLAGSGHLPPLERPEAFAAALVAFKDELIGA